MPRPRVLRFFCELDSTALGPTFSKAVIGQLVHLRAGVTLGLRDLTDQRAELVRELHDRGVRVGLWVLLPVEHGYFATHHNVELVSQRCDEVLEWVARHGLQVEALGLDFEPDLRELQSLLERPLLTSRRWAHRARVASLGPTKAAYAVLVNTLRSRGVTVESYQFPLLLEDRAASDDWWQRMTGSLDVEVTREVVMLYSSLFGALGPGLVPHFAGRARAIGVGSTGGGVDPLPKLDWPTLRRDLLLAARACDDVSIFSLEGCVAQGFLPMLCELDWEAEVIAPSTLPLRAALRSARVVSRLIS
jgi:hypothetical protein